jgi:poly-gamma-glutamate synthesis protein (capsule biosynthesis protein)
MKILLGGDFYGGSQNGSQTEKRLLYNAESLSELENLKQLYDYFIFNLESPVLPLSVSKINKTGPTLHINSEILHHNLFKENTILTLANNHIMDYGDIGLNLTINELKKNNIRFLGAGTKQERFNRFTKVEKDGFSLGILNVSENEWSSGNLNGTGANPINPIEDFKIIRDAKKECNVVITIFHGGLEYYSLPTPEQQKTCRFLVDAGSDVVVCHHSHYYSGFEKWNDKPIFYGLGNFIFDHQSMKNSKPQNWYMGLLIDLDLTDLKFKLIPIRQSSIKSNQIIEILEGSEKESVLKRIVELNEVIKDESNLVKNFEIEINRRAKTYMSFLQPYNSTLRSFYKRGLLPDLLSRDYILLLSNIIRCETHREIILKILQSKIKNENSNT